jgi:2-polyprenyl-3-methyl-5-hydroxy-6-metoxy-1,4-benzoquinol methylase
MTEITSCPVCSFNEFSSFLHAIDYTVSKERFSINTCKGCGFLFTSPRPDLSVLGNYYHSDDYISHSDTSKGLISKLYKVARSFTLDRKFRLVSNYCKEKPLLDVGCGTGAFLSHASSKGLNVVGIEPDNGARSYAIQNYNLTVFEEQELSLFDEASFGAITLWHVLEHVSNLDERLSQLRRLLRPEGRIFIAVPNPDSFDARHYQSYWAAYDVPRHLWHFTPQTMRRLLQRNSLILHDILPMKLDAFYISLLSERYKYGKEKYLSAFINGMRSNLKAGKEAWSSQIYVIGK